MINSDFDRVIRGENNYNINKKKGKFKIIILIFILIILIAGALLGYSYYSKYQAALPRMKFFEYVSNTNIEKLMDTSIIEGISKKISESSYTINNDISIQSNQEENDMQNLNIDLDISKDIQKDINMVNICINNGENELIEFSGIKDKENVGIKSDEIVVKYIGSKITNLGRLANRIYGTRLNVEMDNDDNIQRQKIKISNEEFFYSYKQIIASKLSDEQFKIEKNVKLTQNNSSIDATLYQLSFNKEEVLSIITELKDNLIKDDDLINSFINGQEGTQNELEDIEIDAKDIIDLLFGYKIDSNIEKVKEEIENNFTKIFETLNSIDNLNFRFDIYVSNSKVIKQVIALENLLEINLDYETKSENENYAKATFLLNEQETENKNGFSLSLNRLNNNVTTSIQVELSIIENMQINNKYKLEMKLEGNESSNVINNDTKITILNTENEYVTNINSKLEYVKNDKIEELNPENCLFLDELDDQTLSDVVNAVSQKAVEVFFNKINEFSNPIEVEENDVGNLVNIDGEEQHNEEEKNIAKNKLIDAIKAEMLKAREENREYVIADLQGLEIEDSVVSVIVSENLAIVAIDGYTFYISPDFELTEE